MDYSMTHNHSGYDGQKASMQKDINEKRAEMEKDMKKAGERQREEAEAAYNNIGKQQRKGGKDHEPATPAPEVPNPPKGGKPTKDDKELRSAEELDKYCYFFQVGKCPCDSKTCPKKHEKVKEKEISRIPKQTKPRPQSRPPSTTPKSTGKIVDRGSIDDPANPGQKIEWVQWDNSRKPEGKKKVPSCCFKFLKDGVCEGQKTGKCTRPHIKDDEKKRREKVLNEHRW